MKTYGKKILTALLTLALIISLVPNMAYAADAENSTEVDSNDVQDTGDAVTANIDYETLSLNCTSATLYYKTDDKNTYYNTLILRAINSKERPKYSSTNKKVATVSSSGVVTAKGIGTCKIKVTVGSKVLTCNVDVVKMPSAATVKKNVTASCKFVNGQLIITAKNKLKQTVYYLFYYKGYSATGEDTVSYFDELVINPGETVKHYLDFSKSDVVEFEKAGYQITTFGNKYLMASSKKALVHTYMPQMAVPVTDDITITVKKDSNTDFRYTVINNTQFTAFGESYIVFYKNGNEVSYKELVSTYADSGVTNDSFSIDESLDYDSYKIIKNGYYIRFEE